MEPNYLTHIERNYYAKLAAANQAVPQVIEPTWYFSVCFEHATNGIPIGYLRRYEAGDDLRHPSAVAQVPGRVVGTVQIENGRALFDGHGHIEFLITEAQVAALDKAKLDDTLLSPKPLLMIGSGHVDTAMPKSKSLSNPVLYYKSGLSEFGLFVPDGSISSKVNLEVLGSTTAHPRSINAVSIWHASVEQVYDPPQDNAANHPRYRLAHKIVDADSLEVLDTQEFLLQEAFQVPLRPNAVFYVGGEPSGTMAPFHGWLSEVIFDPAAGSGNSGGGTGKPSMI